jgi:hypothetical protein
MAPLFRDEETSPLRSDQGGPPAIVETPNNSDSCQGVPEALKILDQDNTGMDVFEFRGSKRKVRDATGGRRKRVKGNPDPTTQQDEEHSNR